MSGYDFGSYYDAISKFKGHRDTNVAGRRVPRTVGPLIKVLVPDMPTADELLPYLRRIDEARVYVNRGPLVRELEERLEKLTGAPCVALSSGTSALELSLQAINVLNDLSVASYAAVPALTFAATGLAVQRAGLTPLLCDVDPETWQLTPATVHEAALRNNVDEEVSVPVAAFGFPVDNYKWEDSLWPVVVDAAGALGSQEVSRSTGTLTCFSLHATKPIGCGEGGIVATHNADMLARVRELSEFGPGGTNAKMSEYHAAVALASLDRLPTGDSLAMSLGLQYACDLQNVVARVRCSDSLCVVELKNDDYDLDVIQDRLLGRGIETKRWYSPYLNERAGFPYVRLPVTGYLSSKLLGLPYHRFLTREDVAYVCEQLKEVLS